MGRKGKKQGLSSDEEDGPEVDPELEPSKRSSRRVQQKADAETEGGGGDDAGAPKDGKKLTRNEKKKLEQAQRLAALAAEGASDDTQAPNRQPSTRGEEGVGSTSLSDDIRVPNFDISFPKQRLLVDAKLELLAGRKYRLVAPNGTGKSTLLKKIATRQDEFKVVPSHFDVWYVEQEVSGDGRSALQTVLESDQERIRLLAEEKRLEESEDVEAMDRLTEISDRLDLIEAYNAEGRASAILSGLQFTDTMKQQATETFSGGWRMRIAFACALFCRPTLLMLDEPTNHLDLHASVWLETYLQKWKRTLLIVSHDQEILNTVCTDIIHIHSRRLHYYSPKNPDTGAYDYFVQRYGEELKVLRREYDRQMKVYRANQSATQPGKDGKPAKGAKPKAKGRRKGDDSDDEAAMKAAGLAPPDPPPKDYDVQFEFPDPENPGFPVIKVEKAGFRYEGKKPLFGNLDFGVDLDSRIALIGANGAGKSTLMKMIAGELEPTQGEVYINRKADPR